ncbi:MAG: hypothetical protein ACKO38_04990 [Planctomycetota bacterium]
MQHLVSLMHDLQNWRTNHEAIVQDLVASIRLFGHFAPQQIRIARGWGGQQWVLGDAVVTDYNGYIEEPPKAERPGVTKFKEGS